MCARLFVDVVIFSVNRRSKAFKTHWGNNEIVLFSFFVDSVRIVYGHFGSERNAGDGVQKCDAGECADAGQRDALVDLARVHDRAAVRDRSFHTLEIAEQIIPELESARKPLASVKNDVDAFPPMFIAHLIIIVSRLPSFSLFLLSLIVFLYTARECLNVTRVRLITIFRVLTYNALYIFFT